MSDPPHARSWWTTLPGVLTGIAALITAGTGLLAVLIQSGAFERRAPEPAPRPAPVGPTVPTVSPSLPVPAAQPAAATADGITPLVLRQPIELGSMRVQVLDIQQSPMPNALLVRVTYRIEAGETRLEWPHFRDLFHLVADGAARTMDRTLVLPGNEERVRLNTLPARAAVDVMSEFLIPPANDLVVQFTELKEPRGGGLAVRGDTVERRRIGP
jgi:hypothetical protein